MQKSVSLLNFCSVLLFFVSAFFLDSSIFSQQQPGKTGTSGTFAANLEVRDHFFRSRSVFESTGKGRVAFLGGSITEMEGYRPMLCDYLQERFPQTEFDFIDAGISSTCSTTGAFRLEEDVLSHGPVDLIFVEFAVNDNQDGFFDETTARRGMEGIIRHIRSVNPQVDVVMTFFVNPPIMDAYRAGTEAVSISAHRQVAEQYGICAVNLAREVTEQIDSGKLTWEEFGGVHPAQRGNRICADMIVELLENNGWSESALIPSDQITGRPLPEPLDKNSYFDTAFLSPELADVDANWTYGIPDWDKTEGEIRANFLEDSLLVTETAGASGRIEFSGSVIAAYILAGPDAGCLEYRIDGEEQQSIELYHPYSTALHYPRSVIFADALDDGNHTLEFTSAAGKHGQAVRILQFAGKKAK